MILLDIGAWDTTFAKKTQRLNPWIFNVALCADPYTWNIEPFPSLNSDNEFDSPFDNVMATIYAIRSRLSSRPLASKAIQDVMIRWRSGVHKILGRYEGIPDIPNDSIDIVTINSPHPMYPSGYWFGQNVARILKKGGIFYYSHTDVQFINETIPELQLQRDVVWFSGINGVDTIVYGGTKIIFPRSPTVYENMRANHYWTPVAPVFHWVINPGSKVWIKK